MKRALVLLAALAVPAAALAWESVCSEPDGALCQPAAGPNTARNRWVGTLDEHRALWEETRIRAGLPSSVSDTVLITVYTSAQQLDVGGQMLTTLRPSPFASAEREQVRAYAIGELAQLPDFSYALWDWATGHETCPLGAVGVDAESCHDFASHMGPVNSNHFLPQAASFYARYHGLAMSRATACAAMKAKLGADAPRFDAYLKACEVEALTLEAVGHHYLQDAWSSGHMWERWGAPDLSGFEGQNVDDQRERAVLVALVSGLIHGSRGVLQKLPEWTSYDVNDAMCAPNDAVEFVASDGTVAKAVGDDYLGMLASNTEQSQRFFSCAASGMLDVYETAGQLHGAIGAQSSGWTRVNPVGDECFGQRVTNRAVLTGMGIQMKVAGVQLQLPLDGRTVSWLVPKVAQQNGGVAVEAKLKHRFRLELMRMVSVARIVTHDAPQGTQLASGRLGAFLGAQPNGAHVQQQGTPLASYIDPDLPWPDSQDSTDADHSRAQALSRMFHQSHSDDFCRVTTGADLDALKAHAGDAALDAPAHQAACHVCAEVALRHLRVGTPTTWDGAREPLCHFLAPSPAYLYQPGTAQQTVEALALTWCGC